MFLQGEKFKFDSIAFEQFSKKRRKADVLMTRDIAIISGSANIPLARSVVNIIRQDLGLAAGMHEEGEVGGQLPVSVDGKTAFVIQPTNPSANNLMELLIMIDACRSSGAERIHAFIPYFGFARQDWKDAPRVSITARLVTDLIKVAGASTINTIPDLRKNFIN